MGLGSSAHPLARADAVCETTVPNGSTPPGERPAPYFHGVGKLWTTLPPEGQLGDGFAFIDDDGSIRAKRPWFRGDPGRVVVSGTRLDAAAPALVARVFDGYGETGFQPSAIYFPTRGCWRVTGALGDERLTFVVEVVVGRDTAPVPQARLLRPHLTRAGALVRWRLQDPSWSIDLRLRAAGSWSVVLRRSYVHTFFLHRRRAVVFDVEVRAEDRFGPGPWSAPRRVRFGERG